MSLSTHCLSSYAVAHNRDLSSAAWHLKDTYQSCLLQSNSYDCGVFTLWFAEGLVWNEQVMVLEPAFLPVQQRQHILSVVSNWKIGFGQCVRAERGIPPNRTRSNLTSQTQTDPVARKLAEDQTKNTDLEVAIPHSSSKEETQEEDKGTPLKQSLLSLSGGISRTLAGILWTMETSLCEFASFSVSLVRGQQGLAGPGTGRRHP